MPNNPTNITNITPPRVPLTDQRTGLVSREWYRFFLNMFQLVGQGQNQISLLDVQYGPPGGTANPSDTGNPSIAPDPLPGELLSTTAEMQKQIYGLEMGAKPQLGTMAQLQQAWLPWVTYDTAPEFTPPNVGTVAWDGGTTLGVQMTTNVLGRVNESGYYYIKASSAITKGQVIMFTGAVGASGVPTGAPATGVTDGSYIMGIAAESIALNGFGLVQFIGTLRGVNLSAYADGDILWYNPAVAGGLTKTKPSAPNVKVQMAAIISAANNGTMLIRVTAGSELGGTDSNVQFGTLATNDLIQYNGTYWTNVTPSSVAIGTATNLAGGAAGSVPYQSAANTTTFLGIGTAGQFLKVNSGATAPQWASPAALTKTDDTNVTLTLGGSASTALLNAASLTLGWTGQLGLTRGGTNASLTASAGSVVYSTASALAVNTAGSSGDWLKSGGTGAPVWTSPAALTKTDDTNVTLTLGGSASTALLNAASLTLGWTGQLAVSRGGTGVNTTPANGQLLIGNGTGYTVANLTAGSGVSITNSAGGISISATGTGGTVTSLSVVSANGFAGSVANASTTPAITISTSITGLLYGNGTAIAATTVSAPLTYSAGTLAITQATTSTNGYLSSTDWNTFNNKQPAGTYVTSVTGTSPVVSSGGTTPAISLASGYGDTQNPYASKTANYFLAAPNGSAGAPTFRAIVAADIPSLPYQPTQAPVTYTANFSVAATDVWIINNKSGSSCTATLPTASSYSGRVLRFQNYQAQTLVSASSNVVPIGGGAAGTSILLASAGDQCTLVSDGTNWIMMQYIPNNILLLE